MDNSIQPQNRLRFRDYKTMFQESGFPVTEELVREGSLQELERIRIHPEFLQYTREELAVSHGYIISKLAEADS